MDRRNCVALHLEPLDRSIEHFQVQAQPLFDGSQVGEAFVQLLNVHRGRKLRRQIKTRPGFLRKLYRTEQRTQRIH